MCTGKDANSLDFTKFKTREEFTKSLDDEADDYRKSRTAQLNDTLRLPPAGPQPDPEYRILPARALPDARRSRRD